jgi:RHS repeat-associated protein
MVLPDGSKVVYHYDPLFLKKVERLALSGQTAYEHIYESYDESGYLLAEHLPANLGSVNHTTDAKGQPTAIMSDYFKQACQYDSVGNLTTQIINGTDREFVYDDLSQLISEPDNIYSYDSLYNRTEENGNKCPYNALDEPLSNQETSFIYDMRGNLIKRTEPWQTQRFCYDPLDRLIEAVIEDKRICYSYDPLGRKLKKTVEISGNEQKECFFYDGKNEIGVASDKGEIKQLKVLGLGDHPEKRNAVAIELGGKAYAPLIDVQGNVRALVDMTSKVLAASYDYSAFGKQLPLPNRVFNPWQYASKRHDPDLGLIDFGRRHYDPLLGRWLSIDPAGFVNSHNLYQFNFNNPYRYYDPDGQLIFIPLLCGAFGAGVLGATVVTVELVAIDAIMVAAVSGTALWGISKGLTAIDRAINNHRFSPYYQEAVQEETKEEKKTKKRHTPDQEALSQLAQRPKRTGVTNIDADTLLDWAEEYSFPEARDDRGETHWDGGAHIHIGPGYIPII